MRTLFLLCLILPLPALALAKPPKAPKKKPQRTAIELPMIDGCPKGLKEWQAQGPKILVEKAIRQHAPVDIPDFTGKLGKKDSGAHASVVPFRGIKSPMLMVQAQDEESSLLLSGVLRCDPDKHAPVLVSLTYVKGDKSGLVKIIEE